MADWPEEKLQRIHQARQRGRPARALGMYIGPIVERLVVPRQKKLAKLFEAWQKLLPEELLIHSRLAEMRRGQLRVLVDDSASLYELNLMAGQGLLDQLRELCPSVKVSQIKFVRGRCAADKREENGNLNKTE